MTTGGLGVAICEPLRDAMIDALRGFAWVRYDPAAWTCADGVARVAAGAHVLLTRGLTRVDGALADRLPALGCVAVYGAGTAHLELPELGRRGIRVLRCSREVARSVAEFTLALTLAVGRRIPEAADAARVGEWEHRALTGRDLRRRRVLVVGCGPIGQEAAMLFARMGARVSVARASSRPLPASLAQLGCRPVELWKGLPRAEILSLHVCGGEHTRGLIGARELARLPQGALLVNTARGSIVDLDAVLASLHQGWLGGAALDVLPCEPPSRPVPQHPRLLVTPHLALYSREGIEARIRAVAGGIRRWAARRGLLDGTQPTPAQ